LSGWLTYRGRFFSHKWSSISYRSSAVDRKFTGQKPTLYRCAMQPTSRAKSMEQNLWNNWYRSLTSRTPSYCPKPTVSECYRVLNAATPSRQNNPLDLILCWSTKLPLWEQKEASTHKTAKTHVSMVMMPQYLQWLSYVSTLMT